MNDLADSRPLKIAIIGAGTIGLSFALLHGTSLGCKNFVYDPRPDLKEYLYSHLPLENVDPDRIRKRLIPCATLEEAVQDASIVQEQGPETLEFKQDIWPKIEAAAPPDALFWSSTSGIPASLQSKNMKDKTRLLVVHPYNPPHVMPLLEVVPGPDTRQDVIDRTMEYWRHMGRSPVLVRKECTGFVANRLAFALFREACSLVANGVVSVEDLDEVVQASMGPRWAVAGPFKAYHAGGGDGGLKAFIDKIGGTIGQCWEASDKDVKKADVKVGGAWQEDVCRQVADAYGIVDVAERDDKTRKVLEAVGR